MRTEMSWIGVVAFVVGMTGLSALVADDATPRAGRVEGLYLPGDKPACGRRIAMQGPDAYRYGGETVLKDHETTTDAQGRFVFADVPRGRCRIGPVVERHEGGWFAFEAAMLPVEVRPGETTTIVLGGAGRSVVGAIEAPAVDSRHGPEDVRARIYPVAPPFHGDVDRDMWKAYGEWLSSKDGGNRDQRNIAPGPDGRFRFESVPAGGYWVQIYIPAERTQDGVKDSVVLTTRRFDVPPMPEGRLDEPLDLGRLRRAP